MGIYKNKADFPPCFIFRGDKVSPRDINKLSDSEFEEYIRRIKDGDDVEDLFDKSYKKSSINSYNAPEDLPDDLFEKYLKRRTDGEEPEDMADLFEEARNRELTKQSGNDIIDKNEIEYGVPYLEHSIHADTDYINSPEYDVKFKNITQSPVVNSTLSKITITCSV